ncbi:MULTISPECIES: hypothetical protein [Enterococcus]|uniref:hypothetical protein n=1 Tax=Enterococcus TaxID=1350 RepID=UPI00065DECC2|nr:MULTISPECIES: hypothetical protein [Enterococcus]KAF1303417.1 hypothetical protein BAU16_05025 [Enterococcus sp. JM9B]
MITGLVLVVSLVLFAVSYFLLKKQEVFFALIEEKEENQSFFQSFGLAYGFLGLLGVFIAFFNHTFVTLMFLLVMLLLAAVFGIALAKKMK